MLEGFSLERIQDKIECFEATDLKTLERKIEEQIENNKALLLEVANLSYQAVFDPNAGKIRYSAIVHFKAK
ncbi:YrzA family protein [Paenibacillus cisolokensis]|jgi:Protein of unknown function (DUF2536).|uniref:Sporulation protein cse60 n=1 Tax=Paenibacillus cisolokensis TaxID=1658519 RepID=A0ABQ4NFD0_9BACL|nr:MULTISPECIES: YrzA family protein [Paenibacillus]ALS29747.1 hypothetical protein IJ21_43840 [Paenibacillus sp. 32O-W]GIQ66947.1 hypothetical protein PACILC2_55150 [Paenibacillus cisolokensis]